MSFDLFPRCRTQLLGICSTSAVKPVADEEEVLEERWRALCNAFSNKVCQDLKPVNGTEAMDSTLFDNALQRACQRSSKTSSP